MHAVGMHLSLATQSRSHRHSHVATRQDNLPQDMMNVFLYLRINQQTTSVQVATQIFADTAGCGNCIPRSCK